jgi:DNA-binding transcriptional MerR regulator
MVHTPIHPFILVKIEAEPSSHVDPTVPPYFPLDSAPGAGCIIEAMDKRTNDLLSIGRFAEASRLSHKALRLYDRTGLLPPHHIDPRSGYRFYHDKQLERARLILLLRQINMPIARIKELLDAPKSTARSILDTYWRGVEADLETNRKIVKHLFTILQEEEKMPYPIEVKEVPQMHVVSINKKVSIKNLEHYITHSIKTLVAYARGCDAVITEEPLGIYHGAVNEDSNGPVEICLPVSRVLQPTDEILSKEIPPSKVAFTTITRDQAQFPDILKAYDAIYDWIRQQRHKVLGPPREIYVGDPDRVGPDDPFIEIAWPFR